jgi:hypothetical protein
MTGQVGPRGLAILVLAGIAGILLAILGWSQRGTGLVAPSVGGLGGPAPARTSAPAHTSAPAPATATEPSSQASPAQASPAPPAASSSVQPSAKASVGPRLGSEPYASYAYLVWPGTLSAASQQAMSGLTVSVTRKAGGISVVAGVTGQQLPPAQFFPGGAKVYVIESALGDDSGHLDYNLGDDGLVVTNGQGQIVT